MDFSDMAIPNHLAIIVDGNRRWAKKQGLESWLGHKKGFERLEKIIKYAISQGVGYLSLFVFSTENFNRDKAEVDYLMQLFSKNFKRLAIKLSNEGVKIVFSGDKNLLSEKMRDSMNYMENLTKDNTRAVVNFCLSYGGRAEIVNVCKLISEDVRNNELVSEDINEELFEKYFYQNLPSIDLMIRTSGEQRISNFMLWQLAYAELYFTETFFPDFDIKDFDAAIIEYNRRDRRFGSDSKASK